MFEHIRKAIFVCIGLLILHQGMAQPNISRIEYYLDTDPGWGNGTAVTYSGTNDIATSFILNIVPLTAGIHIVGVRSKDANGVWSLDNKFLFLKPNSASVPPDISNIEYYIDADPGYGNATALSFTGTSDIVTGFNVNTISLAKGLHMIGVRSRDVNGAWSLDNKWLLVKPYLSTNTAYLNMVEYFVDNDPGYGHGIPVPMSASLNLPNLSFTLDMTSLQPGTHIISVRSLDGNGSWSLDNKWLFIKPYNANQPAASRMVTAMEYYMDVDPGYGKAKPVAINAANQLSGTNVYANITGLTNGTHKLFFRTQDDQHAWSMNYVDSFIVNPSTAAPAIIVTSISPKSKCAKDSINISFDASGSYIAGNQFQVQISDPNGTFPAIPNVIGSVTSITSDSIIKCSLLNHVTTNSTAYKVRVISTNPAVTGSTSADTITIYDHPLAQVITGITQVSPPVTLTYSVPNVATSTFNWFVIGGTKVAGGNSNSGDILWPSSSNYYTGTIKIVETSQFGCIGDTSYLNTVMNTFCNQSLSAGGIPSIDSVSISFTGMSNVSSAPPSPYYTNYAPVAGATATVYRGDRFELSLKVNNNNVSYNVGVWVDYNNNNAFDPAENVILTSRISSIGSNWAPIPLSLPGTSGRLRIRVTTDVMTASDYCKTFTNGETEDYTINFNQVMNCRWIGRVSSDWSNAGNWSCGVVPDVSNSVLIPPGTLFSPGIISSDVTVDRLWIMPGAILTVNTPRKITVNGTNLLMTW